MSILKRIKDNAKLNLRLSRDKEFIIAENTENHWDYTYLEKVDMEQLIQELTELKDKM